MIFTLRLVSLQRLFFLMVQNKKQPNIFFSFNVERYIFHWNLLLHDIFYLVSYNPDTQNIGNLINNVIIRCRIFFRIILRISDFFFNSCLSPVFCVCLRFINHLLLESCFFLWFFTIKILNQEEYFWHKWHRKWAGLGWILGFNWWLIHKKTIILVSTVR